MTDEKEWTGEVWQDGLVVAKVSGPKDDVMREVAHYCFVYGQDGPVEGRVKIKRAGKEPPK